MSPSSDDTDRDCRMRWRTRPKACVPGEFVIYLATDSIPERLEACMAELLVTWIEWLEVQVREFPDLLKGAVQAE